MKKLQRGFTLIELLVVIAIIGILSSIVLASLSSARSKGTDAAIQTTLSNMRAQAELFYSNNGNYGPAFAAATCPTASGVSMFATTTTGGLWSLVNDLNSKAGGASNTQCSDSAGTAWAVAAVLKSGGAACADSTGASKSSTTAATAAAMINADACR